MTTTTTPLLQPNLLEEKRKATQHSNKQAMRKLTLVSFVSVFFIAAQVVGGWYAGSIAIFTDSAHLASDMMGFGISIAALKIGQKSSDSDLTFGWHRAEVIGTLISILSIWIMTVVLLVEATRRFFVPPKVEGDIMLIVAIMGLVFNLI